MFCVECGKRVESGWKFCLHCGTRIAGYHPVAPVAEAAEDVASKRCIPGKKYDCMNRTNYTGARKYHDFQKDSELGDIFYNECFVVLEDGSQVVFFDGHTAKNRENGMEPYDYNLYRLDPDGTATFLNRGSRDGIESLYVLDGYAYREDFYESFKVRID